MGFTFTIEYKSGSSNVVANALTRRIFEGGSRMAISMPQLGLCDEIRHEQHQSSTVPQLIESFHKGTAPSKWSFKNGLLFFKQRVATSSSIRTIMNAIHNQGHEGYQKTLFSIAQDFYWPRMKKQIKEFVRACNVCQRHK